MKIFRILLIHELKQQAKSFIFVLMMLVSLLMSFVCGFIQVNDFTERQAVYQEELRTSLEQQKEALAYSQFTIPAFFAISIFTPRSSVSSIVCLLVWIVLVFVLPNIGWMVAGKLHPVLSIAEQNLKEETLLNAADDKTLRISSFWRHAWEEHSKDVYKWKDKNDRMENIRKEIWMESCNKLFRQTDVSIALSKISPFMVFRWIGDRIADNNYYGYRNFQRQAIAYQDAYNNFIIAKDAADPESLHLIWNDSYRICRDYVSQKPVDPNEVPVFSYQTPQASVLISNIATDIVILLLWLGLMFGIVFYLFIKYDVR